MDKIYQKTFPDVKISTNLQLSPLTKAVIAGVDRQSRNKEILDKRTGSRVHARDDREGRKGFTLIELLLNKRHSRGMLSGISSLIYRGIFRFLSCGLVFIDNKKAGDPRQKHSGMTNIKALRMTALKSFRMTALLGFTLIELLVVVLIIGILAAAALPQYQKSVEKARASEAVINLKALETAMELYRMENGKPTGNLDDLSVSLNGERVEDGRVRLKNFEYKLSVYDRPSGRGYALVAYRNNSTDASGNYYIYYDYNGDLHCVARASEAKPVCAALCTRNDFLEGNGAYYCTFK